MLGLSRTALRRSSWSLGLAVAFGGACSNDSPKAATLAVEHTEVSNADKSIGSPDEQAQAPTVKAATQAAVSVRALEELSVDERRQFNVAVAEGRRLHSAEDYEGAVAAFGRALDIAPGQPRTLSEQGWAALFAGRLELAHAVLIRAEAMMADEGDTRLHASILYNLGRVADAQGNAEAATDAYQRSLRLRPHPAAYRHLSAIDGGTRYVFGPAVHPLQGPYKRLSELCAQERRLSATGRAEGDEASFACIDDAAESAERGVVQVPRARRLGAPWKGARFVEVRPSAYEARVHAVLRTEEGWFALPDVAAWARDTAEGPTRLAMTTESFVKGRGEQLVVEVETRIAETQDGTEVFAEVHRVEFLCAVGPSGRPSCTGALPRHGEVQEGGVERARWSTQRRMDGATLVLEGEPQAMDEPVAELLGTHPLVFP